MKKLLEETLTQIVNDARPARTDSPNVLQKIRLIKMISLSIQFGKTISTCCCCLKTQPFLERSIYAQFLHKNTTP